MIGANGSTGPIGPTGLTGAIGPIGIQGSAGPIGPALQGPIGPTGLQGATGLQGPQGPVGLTGPQGVIGAQGIQGVIGLEGAVGSQGLQGAVGSQGIQGIQGPQGPTGLPSLIGLIGPTGAAGSQGVVGPTGITGPMGATGPQGLDSTSNIGRFYGGGWIAAEWVEGPSLTKKVLIVGEPSTSTVFWTMPAYWFSPVPPPGAIDFVFGVANTAAITNQAGVGSYAAYDCENSVVGGYTDWYLPSIRELNMVYNSLVPINRSRIASGFFAIPVSFYWSSTEDLTGSFAYGLSMTVNAVPGLYSKNTSVRILPIRITSI